MDDQESAVRAARPGGRSITVLAVVAVCVVITGGTGLTAILVRTTRHSTVRSVAAGCVAPQVAPSVGSAAVASRRLDGWAFDFLEPGTFGSVVAGPGSSLYALQACGTEETEVRVLHLDTDGDVAEVSPTFHRAALLTSSLVLDGGSLYLGAARLDLSGPPTEAPYDLTLYRLSASSLQVLGSRPLGRGYGLSLSLSDAGLPDATVVASTGEVLLAVRPGAVTPRTLTTFGRELAQHVATDPDEPDVVVSLSAPGAALAAAGAAIEVIDTVTGDVVSSDHLSPGSQIESLAFGGGELFAAISDGMSTDVRRFAVPGAESTGPGQGLPTGISATLEVISLDGGATAVWATDLTTLSCLDSASGRVLGSASSSSSSPSVSGVVVSGAMTYAVTSSGIGLLGVPSACRPQV